MNTVEYLNSKAPQHITDTVNKLVESRKIKPTMQTIKFDLGIYSFHRLIHGDMCADDAKVQEGSILGLLHPLQTVDPSNVYCYAVDRSSGEVRQLVRKNLRFKKVLTLSCELDKENEIETHAKLNAAYKFLIDETKQMQLV